MGKLIRKFPAHPLEKIAKIAKSIFKKFQVIVTVTVYTFKFPALTVSRPRQAAEIGII